MQMLTRRRGELFSSSTRQNKQRLISLKSMCLLLHLLWVQDMVPVEGDWLEPTDGVNDKITCQAEHGLKTVWMQVWCECVFPV